MMRSLSIRFAAKLVALVALTTGHGFLVAQLKVTQEKEERNEKWANESVDPNASEIVAIITAYRDSYQGVQFDFLFAKHMNGRRVRTANGNMVWSKNGRRQVEHNFWYGSRNSEHWEKACLFQGDQFLVRSGLSSDMADKGFGVIAQVTTAELPKERPWTGYLASAHTAITLSPHDQSFPLLDSVESPVQKQVKGNGDVEYSWSCKGRGEYVVTVDQSEPPLIREICIKKTADHILRLGRKLGTIRMNGILRDSLLTKIKDFQYKEVDAKFVCYQWSIETDSLFVDGTVYKIKQKFLATKMQEAEELDQNNISFRIAKIDEGRKCTVRDDTKSKFVWKNNQVVRIVGDHFETLQGVVIDQ